MLSTDVLSSSEARIFPFSAVLTPTSYNPICLVSALLPIANKTVSKTSSISSSPCLKVTTFLPYELKVILIGTAFLINLIPVFSI
jgi:hypothetical protein